MDTSTLRDVDVFTLYGRPGDDVMAKLAEIIKTEAKPDARIVSHVYDLPGFEKKLVRDVDGVKLYDNRL